MRRVGGEWECRFSFRKGKRRNGSILSIFNILARKEKKKGEGGKSGGHLHSISKRGEGVVAPNLSINLRVKRKKKGEKD